MARGRRHAETARVSDKIQKQDKYFSKVIGKALDVLEILKTSPRPLTLKELTQRVGLVKSSVFRILHTLEVAGYVVREPSGAYRIASRAGFLVSGELLNRLLRVATPLMKQLSSEIGETVSLAALFENHIEVVAVVESSQLIRMSNTVGRIIPPHASSLGKSIAAHQSQDRCEQLLRSFGLYRFTPKTVTDETELKQEFGEIRRRGYSIDREESTSEGWCFGAPIFDPSEQVFAALSVSLPKLRLKGNEEKLIQGIRRTARAISEGLGKGLESGT